MVSVGIVAGSGVLPSILADTLKRRSNVSPGMQHDYKVVAACHKQETSPDLVEKVDKSLWVKAGQLGKIIKFFRQQKVTQVVFAGGIRRPNLLRGFWPDLTALNVIRRAGSVQDDKLLREIAAEFERNSMTVLAPHTILPQLLTPLGFTVGQLSTEQKEDGALGWKAAEALGELDVGQTAVAHRGMIVALEGIEGTDACIQRAGELTPGGFTVVKRAKPQQDSRLDLPTIGIETISTLARNKAAALIIHAENTLLLDPLAIEQAAKEAGIAILAVKAADQI